MSKPVYNPGSTIADLDGGTTIPAHDGVVLDDATYRANRARIDALGLITGRAAEPPTTTPEDDPA